MTDESYSDGSVQVVLTPWGHYRVLHVTEGVPLGIVKVLDAQYQPIGFTPFRAGPVCTSLSDAVGHLVHGMLDPQNS